MKLEFEKKISALKSKVENLEQENLALKTRQNSPVYFHAGLRSHITSADYQTLVFDETRYSSKVSWENEINKVILYYDIIKQSIWNPDFGSDDSFDPTTGIFTTKKPGVYFFSISFLPYG